MLYWDKLLIIHYDGQLHTYYRTMSETGITVIGNAIGFFLDYNDFIKNLK